MNVHLNLISRENLPLLTQARKAPRLQCTRSHRTWTLADSRNVSRNVM